MIRFWNKLGTIYEEKIKGEKKERRVTKEYELKDLIVREKRT